MTKVIPILGGTAPDEQLTSLFIAAKPDFLLEGLLRILTDNGENKIVGCVEPSEACWDKLRAAQPNILLLHRQALASPIAEFFNRVKETAPEVRIIVFGQHMEDAFLRRSAGARRPPSSQRAECFVGIHAERGWRRNIKATDLASVIV